MKRTIWQTIVLIYNYWTYSIKNVIFDTFYESFNYDYITLTECKAKFSSNANNAMLTFSQQRLIAAIICGVLREARINHKLIQLM